MRILCLGDLVSLVPISDTVIRSCNSIKEKDNMIIGVCIDSSHFNEIKIINKGITDVNVTGIVCIGDKLTASNIPGKAKAIKYSKLEEDQYNIRSIGKVIGVYDTYDKVKVMLDIE